MMNSHRFQSDNSITRPISLATQEKWRIPSKVHKFGVDQEASCDLQRTLVKIVTCFSKCHFNKLRKIALRQSEVKV